MGRALIFCLLLFLAGTAQAAEQPLPEAFAVRHPGLSAVGSGQLRWFGLPIYRATLWRSQDHRLELLDIHYRRDISSRQLVEISLEELAKLGASDAQLAEWERRMTAAIPGVRAGDRVLGLHRKGVGIEFHAPDGEVRTIDDPDFARAFLGIWLDPRTRNPELRAALLGE